MKKTFESFLLLCIAAMMFVACDEKDNFEPEGSEGFEADDMDLVYEANPRAFALKFTDFIGNGAENIQRLDEDTVRIAIKDGLLLYLGIGELKEGDVLNIWQNIDCPPYIRVVDAAEKTPSGYIVTTHAGSMGDLFHTFEGCFDTKLYSKVSRRPDRDDTRSSGGSDEFEYVDDEEDFMQFVEESGKIHPFICYNAKDGDSQEYDYYLAEKVYDKVMDSLLFVKGPSWMKNWSIINADVKHLNIYPKRDEDGLPLGLFVHDASFAMKANLEFYFQFNLTTSNRFWTKMDGEIDVDLPLHVRFAGFQYQSEEEMPVLEFMPKFFAFSIGPFVVPVVIRHGFVFKYSAALNGNLSFMVPIHYHSTFQAGPMYDDGQWSSLNRYDHDYGINYDKLTVLPSANLSLKGGIGFYYHMGAYLGSAIGPFVEIGPQSTFTADASVSSNEVAFRSVGKIGIGGNVGAEIKIWKFNLGKASMPFYIKSMDLWNFDFSFDPEDIHRKWQSQNQ